MKLLLGVMRELAGMFVDDGALALSVLGVVALSTGLALLGAPAWLTGLALVLGCGAVLIESILRARRIR